MSGQSVVDQAGHAARRVSRSPWLERMARVGFVVSGLLHLLIGYIAVQVAWSRPSANADQSGALSLLARHSWGEAVLWVGVAGFAALGIWQLTEALVPRVGDVKDQLPDRAKALAKGVVYLALAVSTFSFARGAGSSSSKQTKDFTATLMSHTGGRVLVFVVGLAIVAVGGYALWLYLKIGNIDRFDGLDAEGRPDPAAGEALNILLLGEDGDGDVQRSDTIILAHLTEDRKNAYLVSIPRDSYVELYDEHNQPQGMNKINASFSLYGEAGAQATVEQLTNTRIDHVATMNWEGFKDLSTALDGVRVYIPESFYDSSQEIEWEQGWQTVEGTEALQYVRTRHGLTDGDFGRIARQQNFMRSLMNKLINEGMTSPTKLPSVLDAITNNLKVDSDWETGDIRDLAFNMRGLDSENVEFLTAPMARYGDTDVGSVVVLDKRKCKKLWGALRGDGKMTIEEYAEKNKDDSLDNPKKVN